MFLLLPLWLIGAVGNVLILHPGLTVGRYDVSRWHSSVKFYRLSYVAWNLVSLLALPGLLIGCRIPLFDSHVTLSMWIALFTSVHLAALVASLAALFFSAQLKDRFDGYCAAAIIWVIFSLIFSIVGTYEIILIRNFGLTIDLVVKIFLICCIIAYVTYLAAAWFKLHRMQSAHARKDYETYAHLFSDALRRRLFSYGVYILSCAWMPYAIHSLSLLYEGHYEFSWKEQVYAGSSLGTCVTLVLPCVVFLYPVNRGALKHAWIHDKVRPVFRGKKLRRSSTLKRPKGLDENYHIYESVLYGDPDWKPWVVLDDFRAGETEA